MKIRKNNGGFPWAKAGRNLLVFLISYTLLVKILILGMGLDSFGDEELDKEFRVYVEFLSIRIPADWIVPPFVFISAGLITWIDSRQRERKEAAEIQ